MFKNKYEEDALQFDIRHLGDGYRLSRNFILSEAQSGDKDPIIWIHPATIVLVQYLRDEFGALQVNSWYRSKQHNTNEGGDPNSRHLYGMAVDIYPLEVKLSKFKMFILGMKNEIGGIGFYDSFVHLDVYKEDRFWNYESARK